LKKGDKGGFKNVKIEFVTLIVNHAFLQKEKRSGRSINEGIDIDNQHKFLGMVHF